MKQISVIICCLILTSILFVLPVFAHGRIFSAIMINGDLAKANAFSDEISATTVVVPRDLGGKTYTVNEELSFAVDTGNFPGVQDTSQYRWDFGDGSEKQTGGEEKHTYTKSGTFFLTVETRAQTESSWSPFTVLALSVAPKADTVLPKAILTINNKPVDTIFLDYVEVRPGQKIRFDASQSTGSQLDYFWDFGDKETGSGRSVTHIYKEKTNFPVYATLRVKDQLGLTSDAYVSLDTPLSDPNPLINIYNSIRDWILGLFQK